MKGGCMQNWFEVLPDYLVSRDGRVVSLKGKEPVLKRPSVNTHGYLHVMMTVGGKQRLEAVHRLVARAFVPGDVSLTVNHIDGDKLNNLAENLEWVSRAENHAKWVASGRHGRWTGKLSWDDVRAIRVGLARGYTQRQMAARYGINQSNVSCIASGKSWKE